MLSALARIIPPPSYLTLPCVGVDISDNSLKYVSFAPSHGRTKNHKLRDWGEVTVPNGVVKRGQIEQPEQLVAVLREFKAATNAELIRVSLPEERAYLFETEVSESLPYKEIQALMEFRLEENVPIPSRDVLFDFTIIPETSIARKVRVAVAAYPKDTIQGYYEACKAAGLFPVSFEVEAQAMARAMVPQDIKGSVMVVDFGKSRTGVGILSKGILLYTSTIETGGDQLSSALRKILGDTVPDSELTNIKNSQGLVRKQDQAEVSEVLVNVMSLIKDELATRMQYWHLRNGNSDDRRIAAVLMCGGSVNLRGVTQYLSESLGVPCMRGNVWENAFSLDHTVPPINRRHSFGYATAIGLALKNNV